MLTKEIIDGLNSKVWYFRFKQFDENSYLITNDVGRRAFLTKNEFNNFIAGKLNWNKFNELLKKWFIKDSEKDYENKMIKSYQNKNKFLYVWPSLHIIVTTLRCNHKCRYCHAAVAPMDQTELDMSIDTARNVVDTIFYTSNPDLTIEFQWWEPLVNWDVIQFIVKYAKEKAISLKKNIRFALVTNLTLMDDKKLDFIIENDISISTSLDGDEELHNYNRVFTWWNSFEKVTYWIKKINNKYKKKNIKDGWWEYLKVWALLTVTKKTLPKYKEVIDTYIELWLDWIFLRALNPYWFASNQLTELWYTKEDFLDFYEKSMDYILEINSKWIAFREALSTMFLYKILTDKDPNYLDERSPCGACIWQVAYNYDWKIFSCDEWRMLWRMWDYLFQMWELQEDWEKTYKAMMNSETTKIMVSASTIDGLPGYNDNVYKPYIWVCPIHSYKTTWNIFPNYAKDTKRWLDEKILDYLFSKIRLDSSKTIFESWIWFNDKSVVSQCENIF